MTTPDTTESRAERGAPPNSGGEAKRTEDPNGWKALMFKAQSGDKVAYSQLLDAIQPPLRVFVRGRISSASDAEDTVQEILMGIHRNRHTFNGESSFEAWMFSIARFKVIDFIRKKQRRSAKEFASDEPPEESIDAEFYHDRQAAETLKKAIASLPRNQQRIIEAMKIEGQSVREVANELEMSESAVRVNAHRAYKKIKSALLGSSEEGER